MKACLKETSLNVAIVLATAGLAGCAADYTAADREVERSAIAESAPAVPPRAQTIPTAPAPVQAKPPAAAPDQLLPANTYRLPDLPEDLRDEGPSELSLAFEAKQTDTERLMLARTCVSSDDADSRIECLSYLYELGGEEEATPVAVRMVLAGDDLSALTWQWIHDTKPGNFEARMDAIRVQLEAQAHSLSSVERARALPFVCPRLSRCSTQRLKIFGPGDP